ncbi:MAG: type IX secretion system membrane protein PorP/SprF, partial [Saprospiraceae bacterium]|nr:type IX secretion system membrane protein PorP/SprF [Saprospiraceae bacterium]
ENRYYAGISAPQTFGFETRFAEDPPLAIRRVPHLYAVLGGYLDAAWIGNETSFIEPSLWVKYVPGAPLNLDLNARCQISELVWAGTGVNVGFGEQLGVTLHAEAGLFFGEQSRLNFGQFKAGFGLDIPLRHSLVNSFVAAAEINLVYSWK